MENSEWSELTSDEWSLLLLERDRSGSTCLDPLSSWMMWVVNGENGVCGVKSEESLPHIKSNTSWSNYVELLENSS